jgi:hypothetical protein
MQTMRVIFRAERSGDYAGDVTAVFPDDPERPGVLSCYAHIGQHGTCRVQWYQETDLATEAEAAPLLAELRGIYESGPDPVRLIVILHDNDEAGQCRHCGRDNVGYEADPCSDECPQYWEALGIPHPDYRAQD